MSDEPNPAGSLERPAASRGPKLVGMVAAVIVALVALPMVGLLIAEPAVAPRASASASPPSASASAIASSVPSAGPSDGAALPVWPVARLPQPASGFAGPWPGAAVRGGPGWVAVGLMSPCCADVTYEDAPWMSVIWTSVDGTDWQLLPDLDSFGTSGLRSIAVDASGTMLAIGYEVQPPPTDDPLGELYARASRAWRSTNGLDWFGVTVPARELYDVAATPRGWFLAGEVDGRPALSLSTDLASWSAWMPMSSGRLEHLAVGPDGTVVATGCMVPPSGGECRGVAMVQPAGSGELRTGGDGLGVVRDVIAWGDSFVAVGSTEDGDGVAWTSTDGLTWSAGEPIAGATPWTVADVDGTLLVGGEVTLPSESNLQPALWRSSDGVTFEPAADLARLPEQADGRVAVIVRRDDGVSLLGSGFAGAGTALVWTVAR